MSKKEAEEYMKKYEKEKMEKAEKKARAGLKAGYCLFKDLKNNEYFNIDGRSEKFKKDTESMFFQYDDPNAVCHNCGASTLINDLQIVKKVEGNEEENN